MASKLELVRKRASMRERLIVALDVDTLEQASELVHIGLSAILMEASADLFIRSAVPRA